jgi:glycosyltransferase involved in cell wall biosynthesis
MELTVVVPAYNEEASIKETIKNIKKYVSNAVIIVVDDFSKDSTKDIAKKEGVKVISHKVNKGYGAALKTGILAAKTKYVAFLDADMTYNPMYFVLMLKLMKKLDLDCIWGNRFGGSKNKMPLVRKIGNRMMTVLFLLITSKNISDCSSGQRIFRKDAIKKLDLLSLPDDLDFITALSKRIVSRKLRYKVIPINYEKREGSSKLAIINHGFRMMKNIIFEK